MGNQLSVVAFYRLLVSSTRLSSVRRSCSSSPYLRFFVNLSLQPLEAAASETDSRRLRIQARFPSRG